jgi:hypothetical protein
MKAMVLSAAIVSNIVGTATIIARYWGLLGSGCGAARNAFEDITRNVSDRKINERYVMTRDNTRGGGRPWSISFPIWLDDSSAGG